MRDTVGRWGGRRRYGVSPNVRHLKERGPIAARLRVGAPRRAHATAPGRRSSCLGGLVVAALCAVLLLPVQAAAATPPQAPTPVNAEAPHLAGKPVLGQTLTCSTGGWANNPTGYGYMWLRDGNPIAGQTGSTHIVQSADRGHSIACQVTASNSGGEYTIPGLPSGSYEVTFLAGSQAGNYMTQYFNGQSSRSEANRVSVTAGSLTTGIDAAMPAGGEIAGRVTNATTRAAVARVSACAELEGRQEGCAVTNAAGEYTIAGLPSGSYTIWFTTTIGEYRGGWSWYGYYDNKSSSAEANPVSVTAGSVTSGIDTEMQTGQIAGSATSAVGGAALERIEVCAWSDGGGSSTAGCALTNAAGEYTIAGLAAGSYRVEFSAFVCGASGCTQQQNYVTQYYHEKPSGGQAEAVPVTAGNTTPAIDAKMAPGAEIAGQATSALSHDPLANITVCAQSTEQNGSGHCVSTNAAGEYAISGLATGSYDIAFSSEWEGPNYLSQSFDGKSGSSEATPVAVTAGSVRGGIDAELQAGGQITGRVTSAATHGALESISVCAERNPSTPERCVHTNAAGEYTISGLPSGSPDVLFSRGENGGNYATQYFDGQPGLASAGAVAVTAGSVTSGINAAMSAAGEIAGRVTSATGGAAIAGIRVCAIRTSGERYFPGEGEECALTSTAGGSASATSNTLAVPHSNFSLLKAPVFDARTGDLDFYFEFTAAGTLRWNLSFAYHHVGLAHPPRLSLDKAILDDTIAETNTKKHRQCKPHHVKHKVRCGPPSPSVRGSQGVSAGTVEIKIHIGAEPRKVLESRHALHVNGRFTFQSPPGVAPVTHIVSTTVHWHRASKNTRRKGRGPGT